MTLNDIESKIAKIIEDIILTPVETDTLLLESGLVDSLSAVDVALAVEKAFAVKIPPSEIDLHLESVQALAQYVAEHRKA
ncbi:acyl carrier protein [Delftia sp. PS-11]|uniref:acyl carrier protein n=1 Tax=Delftia sp. PS-11 TaxID=2767222 RepID=UPI002453EC76|nr:acyl carrier protein [Delftia sp. PS-11]KAJ8742250.1 acyl carrier protein [Delftia sp. PS-11]